MCFTRRVSNNNTNDQRPWDDGGWTDEARAEFARLEDKFAGWTDDQLRATLEAAEATPEGVDAPGFDPDLLDEFDARGLGWT